MLLLLSASTDTADPMPVTRPGRNSPPRKFEYFLEYFLGIRPPLGNFPHSQFRFKIKTSQEHCLLNLIFYKKNT